MDFRNLKLPRNSYDGIWANAAFVHIPREDIEKTLQGCFDVLRGVMYISYKIGSGEEMQEDKRYDGAKKFYTYFETGELEAIAEKVGFEILKTYEFTADSGKKYATKPFGNLFLKK